MEAKIRTTLLSALFFFGMLTGLQAQDKYDFATIVYNWGTHTISVSINGKDFTEEKVELSKTENSNLNSNPVLIKCNEFQDKGWEVMSISVVPLGQIHGYSASLRKKKN